MLTIDSDFAKMSCEIECLKRLREDEVYKNFVPYFRDLKRSAKSFFDESHFYPSFSSKKMRIITWLCDESGHHVEKFLRQVDLYNEIFERLLCEMFIPEPRNPIQEDPTNNSSGEARDFILETWLTNPFLSTEDFFVRTREKYLTWREATKKGILRKLNYIISNPFEKIIDIDPRFTGKYLYFLRENRRSLNNLNHKTSIQWMKLLN